MPFEVAVVIPTVLRPELARAVGSVYAQDIEGRVQILIGVDAGEDMGGLIDRLQADCPAHMELCLFDPGYSTSARHGGLYPNRFSGALRTILTYLANSRRVAYLDDDNWWASHHLSTLHRAIEGFDWAYCRRHFVEAATNEPICVDEWESVGPNAGLFAEKYGGFVDPSSLMIDKLACHALIPLWSEAAFEDGSGEDRLVFAALAGRGPGGFSDAATSYYTIRPDDPMHPRRLQALRAAGISLPSERRRTGMTLADAMAELPMPPPGVPLPAVPVPLLIAELIKGINPQDHLVLAAGSEATAAQSLAAALASPNAHLLVADAAWSPAAHQRVAALLAGTPLGPRARALPPVAGPATAWLAARRVLVDLVQIGPVADAQSLLDLCRAAWPCLKAGGVMLGQGAGRHTVRAAIEDFARAVGAECLVPGHDPAGDWILQKL